MGTPRILVVDDEPRMRHLICLYLQKEFEVLEAGDGWTTLQRIREETAIPVIMLTARGEIPDRIRGLRAGADDYIPKPFDGNELVARIQAVLRRSTPVLELQPVIRRGPLVISNDEYKATWRGKALVLTPKEFTLLTTLAANPGQIFGRERLLDRIWGQPFEGDARIVDSHIKNLRGRLGDGAAMIATVWGVGYRFEEIDDEAN